MRNAELPPSGLGSVGFARRPEAPSAGLVVPHGFLQVRVLLARQEAELVEDGEVLLRLGKVPEHQERLPDVLVRAPVLWIDGQSLLVDGDGLGRVTALASAVGKPVVGIRVPVVSGDDRFEGANRRRIVSALDGFDALYVRGILL